MSDFDRWFLTFLPVLLWMALGALLWQLGWLIQRRRDGARLVTPRQLDAMVEDLILDSGTERANVALRQLLTVEVVTNFQLADLLKVAQSAGLLGEFRDRDTLNTLSHDVEGVLAARQPVLELLAAVDKQDWRTFDALRAGNKISKAELVQ